MSLVAGIDSSTQSCKVLIVDATDGTVVRSGRASHPEGTEVDPAAWWQALEAAAAAAGGLDDVAAVSVAGQQHGMVALDEGGAVVRDALLWNDTRSAPQAEHLVAMLGDGDLEAGAGEWVHRVGSVPVASFTVTKLAWLRENEPRTAARTAAVALPHDWLTWRLGDATGLSDLVTDRSDASGTGYWSPRTGRYDEDLVTRALGHLPALPTVLGPSTAAGRTPAGALLGAGCGDNAAAALGLGATAGDVVVSVGTSGVVCAVTPDSVEDATGMVSGFADATGRFLPLACTLNAARVLDATARLLGVDHARLDDLAAACPPGADGMAFVPYLEGERTPNEPTATGALHGMRLDTMTPAHLARAAVEGVACSLAFALDRIREQGVTAQRAVLVGGAGRSEVLRQALADLLGVPVEVPEPGEYVALGAARQAAWVASGEPEAPHWPTPGLATYEPGPASDAVRERYESARHHVLDRVG
ncbi:xylulokinase [Nostocoides sp. F2B08]|uniref:xylulokinase n=1 Tax=Nostocoides sp. F2B08 TaxID=2653936 RepID=UPI0012634FF6|nr:xylulokinase [Tetrasphaera sp. F2B08]KAB7745639.1 xylulokinase [Tetrasphaera sp. F2B08]